MKLKSLSTTLTALVAGLAFTALAVPAQAGSMTFSDKTYQQPVPPPEVAPEAWWNAELSAGWDSEYMFRGIDILTNGPLAWTQLTFSAKGFTAGAWYANATDGGDEYSELDLFGSYTFNYDKFAFEVGGIYYLFPESGASMDETWELYAGISYTPVDWLTASVYYYYDFELFEASYLQAKLATSIPITPTVSLDPWVAVAFGDYNNGGTEFVYDHVEVGIALNVALNEYVSLSGYGAWAHAGDGTRGSATTEEDEFWGGASIAFGF